MIQGKSFNELDWKSIGISAGSGAVSGALAGTGIGLVGQVALNAGISATASIVRQKTYGSDVSVEKVLFDAGIGALAGLFGGEGAQHGVKQSYYMVENIGTAFARTAKFTYINPTVARTVGINLRQSLVKAGISNIVIVISDSILTISSIEGGTSAYQNTPTPVPTPVPAPKPPGNRYR